MSKKILLLCLAVLSTLVCRAQTGSVAGEWRGVWTEPSGFVFTADITLSTGPSCTMCAAVGDGSIQGQIVWTLRKTGANASAAYQASVGQTGTEFVRGEMKGDGFFVLAGYRKDDPHNIIGLDQYRLALGDNGLVIGGITRDNGPWTGQLIAMRAQE
jgi:sugar/nucleoside kinase (ribokinase family)